MAIRFEARFLYTIPLILRLLLSEKMSYFLYLPLSEIHPLRLP